MLKDIKVLDLSHVFPGHFAGQTLGDLGAEVIKIEDPNRPDLLRSFSPCIGSESAFFLAVNRNKKSLLLDIKSPEGKAVFLRLVKTVDIVLENFRPGHMDNLGLGYDTLSQINPALIYCNISGFGVHPGINGARGAHDLNFISESGILAATTDQDGSPVMPGISIGALSGGLYATIAILSALHNRSTTGKGTCITTSIFDGLLQMASIAASKIDPTSKEQMPINNYIYKTKDHKYVALAAIEEKFWRAFLTAIQRLDLLPAHGTKATVENPVFMELKALFIEKTQEEWLVNLLDVDCCFSPVWDYTHALTSPYIKAKNLPINIEHPTAGVLHQLPLPFVFSNQKYKKQNAPPLSGEHTRTVLHALGLSEDELALLFEKGVIK